MSAWFHNNIPDMDKEVPKSGGFMWFHIVRYPYAMVLTVYLNLHSIQVLISRMNRYYTDDRRYVLLKAPYVSSVRLVFLPGMKL